MGRTRIKVGDVFTVPLDAERVLVGQVVAKYMKSGYYFAIFEGAHSRSSPSAPADALRGRLLFLALSFDAKLAVGHWEVIGNERVTDDMPLPAYKEVVGTPDRVDVVDWSGQRRRRATRLEASLLPNRTFVSPALLERAVRAKHGLEPWREAFDGLAPPETATSAQIL